MDDSAFAASIDSPFSLNRDSLTCLLSSSSQLIAELPAASFPPALAVLSSKHALASARSHIANIQQRLTNTQSRVLVTGDLNAGKSTLVNSILRRHIAPDDQQPCTALFVELMDPKFNSGREEVHAILDPESYSPSDPSTFSKYSIDALRNIVEENQNNYAILKVYCFDSRPSSSSLLHNGTIDISLIDSPGLNIDSMKTMSLFAKQEEIDVIIFVVNAENHFTLSGRQFLETATKEKAFIFIVVNRFDQIRKKDKCRRDILEQIKSISPQTYQDASTLVHFVSAKIVLESDIGPQIAPNAQNNHQPNHSSTHSLLDKQTVLDAKRDFDLLETSLRSFILEKRSKSKLAPAKIYLTNILSDINAIALHNIQLASSSIASINSQLSSSTPSLQKLVSLKSSLIDSIDSRIESTATAAADHARRELSNFLSEIHPVTDGVEWPGLFHIWHYAHNLRQSVFRLASLRIRRCHEFALQRSLECVHAIECIAAESMPVPPSIQSSSIASTFDQSTSSQPSPDQVAIQMTDLFDASDRLDILKDYLPATMLVVGGLIGYRGFSLGLWKMTQSIGIARMTKLVFVGVGLAGVGAFCYVLSDMKSIVQKKIINKLHTHYTNISFVDTTTTSMYRTTRRALQSTLWEFQSQFQRVLSESEGMVSQQMEEKKRAEEMASVFEHIVTEVEGLHNQLDQVKLDV